MKTKFSLFISVLAVALFGMGCASAGKEKLRQPEVLGSDVWLKEDQRIYLRPNEKVPFTGTVKKFSDGKIWMEYEVKDGLKDGRYRSWHNTEPPIMNTDAIYKKGKLVWLKQYNEDHSATSATWKGPNTIPQLRLRGWNQDGTPAQSDQEKPINK